MERADRETALPARVTTFIEQRKTEDMAEDLVEDRVDVVAELTKTITKQK